MNANEPLIESVQCEVQPIRGQARVLANEPEGNGWRLQLEVPGWPGSIPGQFVMVGAGPEAAAPRRDPLLPRPMAIYREHGPLSTGEVGEQAGIELLYRVVGRGTALLAASTPGDMISLVGPLGQGFRVEPGAGPAWLVGGGTGIASLYELARALVACGRRVSVLLGARSEQDLTGRGDFEALEGAELVCATEDGSFGFHGRISEPLESCLDREAAGSTVFAVGPTPMMRACAELAEAKGVPCVVSLENPMACGFGVCLGCAAPRRAGGFSLVCRAGPVFDAREIAWEGLP